MAEKEYIEREAALKQNYFSESKTPDDNYRFNAEIKFCISSLPAADVAPVKHGHWESYDTTFYVGTDELGEPKQRNGKIFYCHNSDCRYRTIIKTNYCPNCGAKMDGGDGNE